MNEPNLLVAYFLPSIFVRRCVLSTSLMASQRRQVIYVLLRAGSPLCYLCELSHIVLPTFSQICQCSLLTGAHVSLGSAPFTRQLSWTHLTLKVHTYFLCLCTLFSLAPFVACHVFE